MAVGEQGCVVEMMPDSAAWQDPLDYVIPPASASVTYMCSPSSAELAVFLAKGAEIISISITGTCSSSAHLLHLCLQPERFGELPRLGWKISRNVSYESVTKCLEHSADHNLLAAMYHHSAGPGHRRFGGGRRSAANDFIELVRISFASIPKWRETQVNWDSRFSPLSVVKKPNTFLHVPSIVIRPKPSWPSTLKKPLHPRRVPPSKNTFAVEHLTCLSLYSNLNNHHIQFWYWRCVSIYILQYAHTTECIVYTWDYHTSNSIWTGLRVQPILSDEVQTFKALIMVHKVLQEGHPITLREGHQQAGWLETCARTIGHDGMRGQSSETLLPSLLPNLLYLKKTNNVGIRLWSFDPCLCFYYSGKTQISSPASWIQWSFRIWRIYFIEKYWRS